MEGHCKWPPYFIFYFYCFDATHKRGNIMLTKPSFAIRFNETELTFTHLDVLKIHGAVLWGAWQKIGAKNPFLSKTTKDFMNQQGCTIYAIGQTTVWNMSVTQTLYTEEVKEAALEYLIPSYYSIDTPCYCWYLIEDIKDYGDRNILAQLRTTSNKDLIHVAQIAGNAPWQVHLASTLTKEEILVPKIIPRAYNPHQKERNKMTPGLRFQIFKRDGYKCCICGRTSKEDGVKLHVDHKKAIANGGLTELNNLWTLCQDCNLGKGTQDL